MIFFMDQCSFSVRFEWRLLEGSEMQPERISVARSSRKKTAFLLRKLPVGLPKKRQLENPTHMSGSQERLF